MENQDQVTQEPTPSIKEVAEKAERQKNWSEKEYFIIDNNDEIVAKGFSSEMECKKWIASDESMFNVPYTIGYSCYNQKAMVKSQKTIVK